MPMGEIIFLYTMIYPYSHANNDLLNGHYINFTALNLSTILNKTFFSCVKKLVISKWVP